MPTWNCLPISTKQWGVQLWTLFSSCHKKTLKWIEIQAIRLTRFALLQTETKSNKLVQHDIDFSVSQYNLCSYNVLKSECNGLLAISCCYGMVSVFQRRVICDITVQVCVCMSEVWGGMCIIVCCVVLLCTTLDVLLCVFQQFGWLPYSNSHIIIF